MSNEIEKKTIENDQLCKNCRFFQPVNGYYRNRCFAHPPVWCINPRGGGVFDYPEVSETAFCSEWQPKVK